MRAKGLYDDATILITADHGGSTGSAKHFVLLIKEAGSTGDYRTSSASVSGFDLIPYLTSLGGKELSGLPYGMNLKEQTEDTKRRTEIAGR